MLFRSDAIALLMDKQPALETHLAYIIKNRTDAKPSLNVSVQIIMRTVSKISSFQFLHFVESVLRYCKWRGKAD